MKSDYGKFFTVVLCSLFFAAFCVPLFAWPTVNGVAICTAANNQYYPTIVSDGAGGAIITWYDKRNGSNNDIYAQRINSIGSPLWTLNGVAICTAASGQYNPTILSDSSGGAIIAWEDQRSGTFDIYAQRVNSSGIPQWTLDGVAICTAGDDQFSPKMVSDGTGGAIITWEDYRNGFTNDVYAQRINGAGSTLWTLDGVAVCTEGDSQQEISILSDGANGAIITWEDYRSGSNYDIYAQKVDGTGSTLWTNNGVAICTAGFDQRFSTLVSNGTGGIIISWQDGRNGANNDIYAQSLDSSGIPQWTLNGVSVCAAGNDQYGAEIIGESSGGAIITWYDYRNDGGSFTNADIYAQRINSTGAPLWTLNGVVICTAANNQYEPLIVNDDSTGAIITWEDLRNGDYDIYAQRVDSSGVPQWTLNGVAISTAANTQWYPTCVSDKSGGAIITWYDYRNGSDYDIYAQRVDATGDTSTVPVELSDFKVIAGMKE